MPSDAKWQGGKFSQHRCQALDPSIREVFISQVTSQSISSETIHEDVPHMGSQEGQQGADRQETADCLCDSLDFDTQICKNSTKIWHFICVFFPKSTDPNHAPRWPWPLGPRKRRRFQMHAPSSLAKADSSLKRQGLLIAKLYGTFDQENVDHVGIAMS